MIFIHEQLLENRVCHQNNRPIKNEVFPLTFSNVMISLNRPLICTSLLQCLFSLQIYVWYPNPSSVSISSQFGAYEDKMIIKTVLKFNVLCSKHLFFISFSACIMSSVQQEYKIITPIYQFILFLQKLIIWLSNPCTTQVGNWCISTVTTLSVANNTSQMCCIVWSVYKEIWKVLISWICTFKMMLNIF
jgi:hypothetical protein